MTQSTLKAHVAITALGAALAAFAAPALAQDAAVAPPPVVAPLPPAAITVPPVVHTVPVPAPAARDAGSVPVDPAAAAQARADDAARAAKSAPAPKAAVRAPARPAPADKPVAARVAAPPAAPADVTPPEVAPAPAPAPLVQAPPPVQPAPLAAPAPVAAQSSMQQVPVAWWIGGGVAAAIIALALIAFATRRRHPSEPVPAAMQAEDEAHVVPPLPRAEFVPVAAPVVERAPAEPVVQPEPVAAREEAPAFIARTPVFAPTPAGGTGRHEAAALRGPTPENPFLTRRARLKRARFHDRRERLAAETGRPTPFADARTAQAQAAPERRVPARPERTGLNWSGGNYRPAFGDS